MTKDNTIINKDTLVIDIFSLIELARNPDIIYKLKKEGVKYVELDRSIKVLK